MNEYQQFEVMNEQCRGKAPIKVVTDAWQTLIKLSGIDTYSS